MEKNIYVDENQRKYIDQLIRERIDILASIMEENFTKDSLKYYNALKEYESLWDFIFNNS